MSFAQPSFDTFNSTFGGSFYNDPDMARKSVLGQLSVDTVRRDSEFDRTKSAYEDDSDLEPLANSARGALNKAALLQRKNMTEKREKRYFASVTLDANELISDIANQAIMRGTTTSSFPSGMSSASVVDHQRQLEHSRLKIEAAKQASFRQKALYPSMYSEKMSRQRLTELTTRTIKSTVPPDEGAANKDKDKDKEGVGVGVGVGGRDVDVSADAGGVGADVSAAGTGTGVEGSQVLPDQPSNRIPPLNLGKNKTGAGAGAGAGSGAGTPKQQQKKPRSAGGAKVSQSQSQSQLIPGPASASASASTADVGASGADEPSCVLQTFNLGTSEVLNSSSVQLQSATVAGSACAAMKQQFNAVPTSASAGTTTNTTSNNVAGSMNIKLRERQALYNASKTNLSRSNLLIGKVLQSKTTASLGEELKLNSLQSSLEAFDKKMNSVDYQARVVMGGKRQRHMHGGAGSALSQSLNASISATFSGNGIATDNGGGGGGDHRLEKLSGHHSHAALARIGSVVSVDATTALNPSEIMDNQGHGLKRRDDILPTRQASSFGAQMLSQHAAGSGSGASSDDEDGGNVTPAPEAKWMLKVRSLLVLSETTDYVDAKSSVSALNIVDNFHDLAGSALVDRSGKDRFHKSAPKPKSPDLKKKRSDKNLIKTNSSKSMASRASTPSAGVEGGAEI